MDAIKSSNALEGYLANAGLCQSMLVVAGEMLGGRTRIISDASGKHIRLTIPLTDSTGDIEVAFDITGKGYTCCFPEGAAHEKLERRVYELAALGLGLYTANPLCEMEYHAMAVIYVENGRYAVLDPHKIDREFGDMLCSGEVKRTHLQVYILDRNTRLEEIAQSVKKLPVSPTDMRTAAFELKELTNEGKIRLNLDSLVVGNYPDFYGEES
jgi:hypothetical protein